MAVTRTLAQLAGDLRLGDGSTAPTGAAAVVLGRIDATARALVEAYAPTAPDAIADEAFTRLAGWLYDVDPSGVSPGGPNAMRSSGAAALLAPYRVRRAGVIRAVERAVSEADPSNPVVGIRVSGGNLIVTHLDGTVRSEALPTGTGGGGGGGGAAYQKVTLLATQTFLRDTSALPNSRLILDPADVSLTMADTLPGGVEEVTGDNSHYVGIPNTAPPTGVNCIIVEVSDTADGDPYFTSSAPWHNTWGREIIRFGDGDTSGFFYARVSTDTKTRSALVIQAGGGAGIPIGTTVKWYYGRLGGSGSGEAGDGLDAAAVDARVAAGTGTHLTDVNLIRNQLHQLTLVEMRANGTVFTHDITDIVHADTAQEVARLVAAWALATNTDLIPGAKLPAAAAGARGGVQAITNAIVDANTSTGIFGWAISHVRRLIHAIVPAWAREGDATAIPAAKLSNAPIPADGPTFVSEDRTYLLAQSAAGVRTWQQFTPTGAATVTRHNIAFDQSTYSAVGNVATMTADYPTGLTQAIARDAAKTGYVTIDPDISNTLGHGAVVAETDRAVMRGITELAASVRITFNSANIELQVGASFAADSRDQWNLSLTLVA